MTEKKYNIGILEVFIIAFGVVIRCLKLIDTNLDFNEAKVLLFSRDGLNHLIQLLKTGAETHSGVSFPFLLLCKTAGLISTSYISLRILSLIAGISAMIFVYLTAKTLFNRNAALIAMLMLAINPYHIFVSRYIADTAIGIMLFSMMLYAFVRIYDGKNTFSDRLVYIIISIISINYSFHSAILIIPLTILLFSKKELRTANYKWWIPLNIFLIACMAYWWPHWRALLYRPDTGGIISDSLLSNIFISNESLIELRYKMIFIEKYVVMLYATGGLFSPNGLNNGWSFAGAILLPIIYHYFPFIGFREYEDGYWKRYFLFATAFFTGAFVFLMTFTKVEVWAYVLIFALIMNMIFAHGMTKFAGWRAKLMFYMFAICLIFGFYPMMMQSNYDRPDWRKAEENLKNSTVPAVFIDSNKSYPLIYLMEDHIDKIVSLSPDFDMNFMANYKYRQEEVIPVLKQTIDSHAPEGLKKMFIKYGWLWIVREGEDIPDFPRWTKEYAFWIRENTILKEKIDIGGGFILVKYALKEGIGAFRY